MQHSDLLAITKKKIITDDGYRFIILASDFLTTLQEEKKLLTHIIHPGGNAKVRNWDKWKIMLTSMVKTRMDLHKDLFVVIKSKPNVRGKLTNFVFDAFLFSNITKQKVEDIRNELMEGKTGLFVSFEKANELRTKRLTPYYAKLVPEITTQGKIADAGMWIVRKFY